MKDEVVLILDEEARGTDAEGVWPERSVHTLAKSGLLALTLPTDTGTAAGMRQFADVTEKIAKHCASTAMIYLMHVCASQVIAASSSPRRAEVLQKIKAGNGIATLAFSEKGSRSHFWAPVSRASRNSGGAILNCDKSFVTSAGYADYYIVSSGSIDGKGPAESTLYFVEKKAAGIGWIGGWHGVEFWA